MLDAVQDAISEMYVGQKAQAMIPPQLGFCDKGLCGQEMGQEICIVPLKATLVYEIYLKKATIPPPQFSTEECSLYFFLSNYKYI